MGVRSYAFVRFSPPYELVDCFRDTVPMSPTEESAGSGVERHLAQWDDEAKQLFYQNYGDLPYLLDIKMDKHLFRAMVQFWNPAYSCFTFGEVDLVPTLEEYTTLLRCPKIQGNKAYVRASNLPTFIKKLMMITEMSKQWAAAQIQQKGDGKCIPWASLKDLILAHPDVKRRVDVLALSIYGLVIFPKAIGHIDEAVANLFDRLGKQNTPVPTILVETFRSLNACQRVGEGRFIGCAQLLGKVDIHNLQEEDVMWKAPWMTLSKILYRCGSFDWVPLLGIWGVVSYTPLLILRQYKAEQFIPATQGKRVNDNIPRPSLEAARSMEENLRVILPELEVIKRRRLENRGRKSNEGKEKDPDDLKTQYKKTQLSLKRAGLGKSSEQWQQEVQEERAKVEYWEKKFQEIQTQNQALEKENQGLNVTPPNPKPLSERGYEALPDISDNLRIIYN
ncbi:hypothetical protein CXB51_034140 [Gossypium anomalum]|uniref:DUF7745 domain-containing protein n=1 Tax=Gossypium anomalum TaxID=47600 RepID=A0A8J6CN64_9ROSI|nr:hypothetical protein CXB51_034140 [Gossypium anomalum]